MFPALSTFSLFLRKFVSSQCQKATYQEWKTQSAPYLQLLLLHMFCMGEFATARIDSGWGEFKWKSAIRKPQKWWLRCTSGTHKITRQAKLFWQKKNNGLYNLIRLLLWSRQQLLVHTEFSGHHMDLISFHSTIGFGLALQGKFLASDCVHSTLSAVLYWAGSVQSVPRDLDERS